jgi:hypothetical protein
VIKVLRDAKLTRRLSVYHLRELKHRVMQMQKNEVIVIGRVLVYGANDLAAAQELSKQIQLSMLHE